MANLGAHPQGKDAEKITPEYVSALCAGLAVVVDWYLHTTVRSRPSCLQHERQIGSRSKTQEHNSDLICKSPAMNRKKHRSDELLKMCQTYANSLQPIPTIFLFPQDASQPIPPYGFGSRETFKSWGNRVFSVLLPEDLNSDKVESFDKTLYDHRDHFHIESQTPIESHRRIDAAVPEASEINQHVDLLVQIRFPHSPILGIEQLACQTETQALESGSG
jgi:hypothetical protein